MTNYRQYRWRTVKAELDRKQATCELNAESCFAVEKKNNLICLLLHMSKQSSEEWGVAGGGGGRGVSILHSSPVCQLCRRLWAFVTTSACCQDSGWRMGGKNCDRNPEWLSFPCLVLTGGQENWPSVGGGWGEECMGWGGGQLEWFLGQLLQCQPRQSESGQNLLSQDHYNRDG